MQDRCARIIGMMSGTSVDSIDSALCEVEEREDGRLSARLVAFGESAMPDGLRQHIFEAFDDGTGALSLACSLNFEIGEAFAASALKFMHENGIAPASVDAIASHGQTMYHIPHAAAGGQRGLVASTLQLGEPAVIAQRTGVRVIANFRVGDMAVGGEGAPLVPFADYHLFSSPGENVVIQNIGGIANCTLLPASGTMEDIVAFDTGPGNMIIDGLTQLLFEQPFDRDGAIAARGRVLPSLMEEWMAIPYIDAPPPKTTGRELFGMQFCRKAIERNRDARPEDLVATATMFTARSIAHALIWHGGVNGGIARVLIAGGGAQNRHLFELIKRECKGVMPTALVETLEESGFPSKARECIAFAILGYARLMGIAGNVPSATGAKLGAVLGVVVDPPGVQD